MTSAILERETSVRPNFLTIASNLTPPNGAMTRLVGDVAHRYGNIPGSVEAGHVAALKQLWRLAYRQASTLAYADAFRIIMIAFVVATFLVPLLRNVAPPKRASASSH